MSIRLSRLLACLSAIVALAPHARAAFDKSLLADLISIPSVTASVEQNNRAVEFLKGWLDARGVHTFVATNDVGRSALYASTVPGRSHDYVFVTHLDVVPPSCEGQFKPFERDGYMYGRGACDTKGNVALIAHVLTALVGRASVGAVFATDEEGRSPGKDTPTLLLDAGCVPRKFILVGDANGEFTDSLVVAQKGHVVIKMRARGKGGHSSMPWISDNPIPKLTAAYEKLRAALPPPSTKDDRWHDDLSPTQLVGSNGGNIIPDAAEMSLSFRFTTADAPFRMKELIEKTTGLEAELPNTWRSPVVTDAENPFVQRLLAALRAKWPKRNFGLTHMSGATDATRYVHLKLPCVVFGAKGDGTHAVGECVSLESIEGYVDAFVSFFNDCR